MSSLVPPRRPPSFVLRLVLIALSAALAVALAWLFRSGRPPRVEATAAPAAHAAPAEELARLRDEVKLLRRQMQVVASERAPVVPAAATAAAESPPPPPLTPEAALERDRKHFEHLERKLAGEPIDASWAPATERAIAAAVAKPTFAGSKLVSASCHSTLCRVEVTHESERHSRHFRGTLPTRLPELPSGSMRRGPGPEPRTIIYFAREGHQLPRDGQDAPGN